MHTHIPHIHSFNPLTARVMCMLCAVMTSVTRHIQHNFYAFRGTAACTDYWLCYWHCTILYYMGCG